MHYTPYALPLFAAAGALALLGYYGWRHRTAHPAAPAFVLMVLCVTAWLAAYGLQLMGTWIAIKETWETVIIIVLAWMPLWWLVFTIRYSGQEMWLTRRNLALLPLPPIVTTILTLTNPAHHLVWSAITLDESGPFLATVPTRGPWFWVHTVFTYGYILFGMGLLIVIFSRSPVLFRRQSRIVLISSLIPLAGNAAHLAGLVPVAGLDPGAFLFALSAGLIALGLFRYRLLDVVPVAQRTVMDHLHDGVIVLDPHERIVDLNPAVRQMLHLGSGELAGQLAAAVLQPELLATCRTPDQEPEPIPVGTREAQRWVEVAALPLMEDQERCMGRILVFHDVTEERAAELLRQDLTRITIHDLRNPLNVVWAALDVLANSPPEMVAPSMHSFLELAQRGCQRALDLVNSILQISQLESGEMPLNRRRVRANELIAEVVQGMELVAQEGQLELSMAAPADLPTVWADATLLRRIIENLVGNALKFTPPGGQVQVTAWAEGDSLLIKVGDTGPGIPPALQGRLFQKFCTGDVDQRGSGLGLAFCKLATEAHGGRIWIESRPEQGTTVFVSLPLSREP